MILSALAILAVVGSALAFKPMQFATTYCTRVDPATCANKISFKETLVQTGITDPCENGAGKEYLQLPGECREIISHFEQVEP